MFAFARAVVYATVFIGLVLVLVPASILDMSGVSRPTSLGLLQLLGVAVATVGAVLALWCIAAFVQIGKGTPAPFDPPRRLVARGPYRYVRNPMYIGAALALAGGAIFYRSPALLAYFGLFVVATHSLVLLYEEPVLRRQFGEEYTAYCDKVRRWLPRF